MEMKLLGLSKKKSVSSNYSTSSVVSSDSNGRSNTSRKNSFVKFDEKQDYVRRYKSGKRCANDPRHPCPVSFCLGK
ncbi:Piso0_002276 [Millerozyma farinosa CBS 7064]|uniref:Piso0_002276 protein n=1 Tax=Pichia sorbitophila (strain ATCC MYA-4447 / BCRC 22081 / CBS 7064 / NBRC 10061 / NRRL Y-12695) TaxID=559304 RepID=G8YEL5_PICSO|nr:Piso0_002276 [Millerozyma farinosa CBS 7064]